MVLNRIAPLSLAKVMGGIYGGLGLVFGCIFALASLVGAGIGAAATGEEAAWLGAVFGIGAVIFLPLLYGGIAFLAGLLVSALYNLVARFLGGIELDLQ